MHKIYCLIGKSASGKDTIYKRLLSDENLQLQKNVMYTTRPIRIGEVDGIDYHYVDETYFEVAKLENRVIESRCYNTIYGPWIYFTLSDEIDLEQHDYLIANTLEGYRSLKDFYDDEIVIPIYIQVPDIVRLERASNREKLEENPKCSELCRRFLADEQDFSEEKLLDAQVFEKNRFENNDLDECLEKMKIFILEQKQIKRKDEK